MGFCSEFQTWQIYLSLSGTSLASPSWPAQCVGLARAAWPRLKLKTLWPRQPKTWVQHQNGAGLIQASAALGTIAVPPSRPELSGHANAVVTPQPPDHYPCLCQLLLHSGTADETPTATTEPISEHNGDSRLPVVASGCRARYFAVIVGWLRYECPPTLCQLRPL
jgi:hypothetical protein